MRNVTILLIVINVLFASVSSKPIDGENETIKSENDGNTYSFRYKLDDETIREESVRIIEQFNKETNQFNKAPSVTGKFSYFSNDGYYVSVIYGADSNGSRSKFRFGTNVKDTDLSVRTTPETIQTTTTPRPQCYPGSNDSRCLPITRPPLLPRCGYNENLINGRCVPRSDVRTTPETIRATTPPRPQCPPDTTDPRCPRPTIISSRPVCFEGSMDKRCPTKSDSDPATLPDPVKNSLLKNEVCENEDCGTFNKDKDQSTSKGATENKLGINKKTRKEGNLRDENIKKAG